MLYHFENVGKQARKQASKQASKLAGNFYLLTQAGYMGSYAADVVGPRRHGLCP